MGVCGVMDTRLLRGRFGELTLGERLVRASRSKRRLEELIAVVMDQREEVLEDDSNRGRDQGSEGVVVLYAVVLVLTPLTPILVVVAITPTVVIERHRRCGSRRRKLSSRKSTCTPNFEAFTKLFALHADRCNICHCVN